MITNMILHNVYCNQHKQEQSYELQESKTTTNTRY